VDHGVTLAADHKGLAAAFGHDLYPFEGVRLTV
jgi:hypothetical protein